MAGKKSKGKDKDKAKATSTLTSKAKGRAKANAPKRDDGQIEIAAAEKSLAEAVTDLERARDELSIRESTLTGLLEKHGRLPIQTPAESPPQVTEPLFDQEQVVDDPHIDEDTETAATPAEPEVDDAVDDTESESIVALFDQLQVIR